MDLKSSRAKGEAKILTWGVGLKIWKNPMYILSSTYNRWSDLIIY